MRLGQKNGLVRQWAPTGSRPRQPKDQRYKSAYLFGAICPARGTGAALMMPSANTHAMQAHLGEISQAVAPGAHAVLLMDRAGWHTTGNLDMPHNITPILLPSRAPRTQPGRERLAVLAPDLSLKPRLRRLRRHHRGRLRGLEPPHRKPLGDHVHRHETMGSQRSRPMTVGIRHDAPPIRSSMVHDSPSGPASITDYTRSIKPHGPVAQARSINSIL